MKILLITDLYPISLYSDKTIPSTIEDFAFGLKKIGCEIKVVRPNFVFNSLIRGHRIIKNGEYYSRGIVVINKNFFLPFLNNDVSYLKDKFDVIISHMPSGHIYSYLINKKLNLPHIVVLHQSDWEVINNPFYKFYFRKLLKNAIKNSTYKYARNKFLKEAFNAQKVLPSFVKEENILEYKEFQSKKIKFITLSKFIKRKNINLVIEALSKIDFDFRYDIFGEGKEKNNLQKLINKLNLSNKIKIHPFIPHKNINFMLDKSDVFILPSIKETFGISYIEAMARGLVVAGCKNTGIDGIIEDGMNGFLTEPNVNNIVNTLYRIQNSSKEEISNNAIETVKNLTEEKVINEYYSEIKKIVELYI